MMLTSSKAHYIFRGMHLHTMLELNGQPLNDVKVFVKLEEERIKVVVKTQQRQ